MHIALFLSDLYIKLMDLKIHSAAILKIPVRLLPENDRKADGPDIVAGMLLLESWLTLFLYCSQLPNGMSRSVLHSGGHSVSK